MERIGVGQLMPHLDRLTQRVIICACGSSATGFRIPHFAVDFSIAKARSVFVPYITIPRIGQNSSAGERTMDAEAFVIALLDTLPNKEIRGRKRLQKLGYITKAIGAPVSAKFSLHDYGPYSSEIASATEMLTFLGELDESDVQLGAAKIFVKTYKLNNKVNVDKKLSKSVQTALELLRRYSTIELEIASTILFFHKERGLSWARAIGATEELKPSKSVPQVVSRATEALAGIGLYEGRGADQVPCS
jgi:uncharacterized protein YwgA